MFQESPKRKAFIKAFIFTTDAFLVLPLVLLVMAAFISFSVSLRENLLTHEYTYLIARDTMSYLSDLKMGEAGFTEDTDYSILDYAAKKISENGDINNLGEVVNNTISIPENVGYIFEYDEGSGWQEIVRDNQNKIDKYKFSVSSIKIITPISKYQYNESIYEDCTENIICASESPILYTLDEVLPPLILRIRVFI